MNVREVKTSDGTIGIWRDRPGRKPDVVSSKPGDASYLLLIDAIRRNAIDDRFLAWLKVRLAACRLIS